MAETYMIDLIGEGNAINGFGLIPYVGINTSESPAHAVTQYLHRHSPKNGRKIAANLKRVSPTGRLDHFAFLMPEESPNGEDGTPHTKNIRESLTMMHVSAELGERHGNVPKDVFYGLVEKAFKEAKR